MSRPSSSKGKKGKKGQTKTPKQQVKELTEQNAELVKQLDENRENLRTCEDKLSFLTVTLLRNLDPRDFGVRPDTEPLLVPAKALEQMVSSLSAKKKVREVSVEARIEELETRVTQMNSEIAKMCKKTIAYENGLQDLLSYNNIDEMKDKVYDLQFIAGKQYESIAIADSQAIKPPVIDGIERRNDAACRRMIDNEIELNLVPPADKLPGDTHISDMHNNLRLHLINELSYTKRSGMDWRMLGDRVGIVREQIEEWQNQKLDMPAGRVFSAWSQSDGATVRLLHRHLISPEMRCTFLAKRLADFYDV